MMKTVASVRNAQEKQRQMQKGKALAQNTLVCVMMGFQLLLWITFFGYDRSRQAVWQSAVLLLVPGMAVHALWKRTKSESKYLPLMLLPCLLADAAFLLFAIGAFIGQLMPQYPHWLGYGVPCAFAFVTVWLSKSCGVENGAFTLKGLFLILFVFSTVFLRASNRSDRLWPIMGNGLFTQLKTAFLGSGCLWGTALLFVLPRERGEKTVRFLLIPWIIGCIWALWHGFVRPWAVGDAIAVGEKLMGLARHAHSVTLYEIAGLMWMAGIPLCLCGCLSASETLVTRAFPKFPRVAVIALFALLPFLFNLLENALLLLETILPWRIVLSVLAGVLMQKEAKK